MYKFQLMNNSFVVDQYEKIYHFTCVTNYEKRGEFKTLQDGYNACSSNKECVGIFLNTCGTIHRLALCMTAIDSSSRMIAQMGSKGPTSCIYKKMHGYGG